MKLTVKSNNQQNTETQLAIINQENRQQPTQLHVQQNPGRQLAQVTGVIKTINKKANFKDPTTLKIFCPGSNSTFVMTYNFFCPLREGDVIYGICCVGDNQILHLLQPPFVQPAIDKDYVIQSFIRAAKIPFLSARKLYDTMSKSSGGDENVIGYLSTLSQNWSDNHNSEMLNMFDKVEPEMMKKLLSWWHKERNLRRLYLFGLNNKEINACRLTCDQIYEKCMSNPYVIPAIPLEKCNSILGALNKKPNNDQIIRGAIIRLLWKNLHERSWTCTPNNFITRQYSNFWEHVEDLKQYYGLIVDGDSSYLKFPHKVEKWIADYIIEKVKQDTIKYDTPIDDDTRHSAHFTLNLSEDQMRAVHGALDHTVSVITGGPGSGKSTTLGQIVHNLELRNITYAVCSFTGKAVARVREITKSQKPSTIHRLIFNAKKDPLEMIIKTQFEKDIPLSDYSHVIFDETSMITTELLYQFLKVYPNIKKLTFVGDCNQLQPIGWGCFFYQLLKSETVPTYKLTTNFRVTQTNGNEDGIILNSMNLIKHNPQVPFHFELRDNFRVMEGPIERVYDIIKGCFASKVPAKDIVVLTPYNRYLEVLNKQFQNLYDIGKPFKIDSRGVKWMIDDRVMLTENDAEIGVFNGETGSIVEISDKMILVDFGLSGKHEFLLEPTAENRTYSRNGGATVGYKYQDSMAEKVDEDDDLIDTERTVKKLAHAFACSIDKSQGSEWAYVILYIEDFRTGGFLNKPRIYTAFTRSKTMCWIVASDVKALHVAAVKPAPNRYDNLANRLSSFLPNLKPFNIGTNDIEEIQYDPMDQLFDDNYDDECY